jgi:hypothetical protein
MNDDSITQVLADDGLVEIVLPSRPSPYNKNTVERMHARDLGANVFTKTEQAFRTSPAEAVKTLHWYLGCAKGSGLMDGAALDKFSTLASEFSNSSNPKEFFQKEIRTFLFDLKPKRKG